MKWCQVSNLSGGRNTNTIDNVTCMQSVNWKCANNRALTSSLQLCVLYITFYGLTIRKNTLLILRCRFESLLALVEQYYYFHKISIISLLDFKTLQKYKMFRYIVQDISTRGNAMGVADSILPKDAWFFITLSRILGPPNSNGYLTSPTAGVEASVGVELTTYPNWTPFG